MKISVVIPAYNEEKFLSKCLEAFANQEEKPEEIIVVDNNSTDKTAEIAKKFNARVVSEKTQGMTYARNRGFNEATGDVIARCDADTVPPPDWIKKIRLNFSGSKIDALSGPLKFYDLPLRTTLFSNIYACLSKLAIKSSGILMGPNMVLTKKMWERIKHEVCLENSEVHEDVDLTIHINKAGGVIMYDKKLPIGASARRITKNPLSFFIEYPARFVNTVRVHQKRD